MNSSTISAIGGGISMQSSQQQQSHQMPPNTIVKPPSLPQMLTPSLHQQMQNQQDRSRQSSVSSSRLRPFYGPLFSFIFIYLMYQKPRILHVALAVQLKHVFAISPSFCTTTIQSI